MPLMDSALVVVATWLDEDTDYGQCDECGHGSTESPRHTTRLRAADDDDSAPWLCEDCYEGRQYDVDIDEDEPEASREYEDYGFHEDYAPAPPRLLLPVLDNRSARMVSIEQEVGSGAVEIAQRLYAAGFSTSSELRGYHSDGRSSAGGFCRVEEDASVNGEVIYGKLRLDNAGVARQLEDAVHIVRATIADGVSKLDMRCGLHVHVDAKGLGMRHIESLYHLWNHIEDVVFCLASANWSAHRSEVASHDYAPKTEKGLDDRGAIGYHLEHNRGALNVSNYLAARGYCTCGAFTFEAWESCTCDLRKATIEFRVFNATANLRKLHGYTALCLAIVEEARQSEYNPLTHRPNEFAGTRGAYVRDDRKAPLALIFDHLPLTGSEREDLAYCARNSCLAGLYEEMYPAEQLALA